jgi:Bifunctional DNA primase/polymerase, N-terminal/AAA domain
MESCTATPKVSSAFAPWIIPIHCVVDGKCSCGKSDCDSPAKHPRTAHGLKDATTDAEQHERWWRKWPRANLAIATEPSGLVVIDVDAGSGGFDTLLQLEATHGRMPETVEARTGSGGRHLYFVAPTDRQIGSRNGWRPGIDVKAMGGYVLAPPSVNLAGPYTWEPGCGPGEIEIAEIPDWLLSLLPVKDEPKATPAPSTNGNGHASLLQRAQQYVAKSSAAGKGTRNSTAFNLAGHVAAIVDDYGGRLGADEIVTVLSPWALRCNPPLDDLELRNCVDSALKNGSARPAKQPASTGHAREHAPDSPKEPLACIPFQQLCEAYPRMRKPVLGGWARRGETVNIIAPPKFGKSWLSYLVAISEATATPLFGRVTTTGGRVLHVDNELHPNTLAHRIPAVGDAMGIPRDEYEHKLDIISLRGRLRSFGDLVSEFSGVEHGHYSLITFDAKYRFATAGVSENDNAAETQFYNLADELADRTGAVVVFIHHASKGNQADKRVTDMGAGAGAQSRAADCHIVLREHEESGVVVLEAAVRSFPPFEPLALRWQFPLWVADSSVDPGRLRRQPSANEQRQQNKDREGMEATIKALRDGPATARSLRGKTGFGEYRQQRLLDLLTSQGHAVPEVKSQGKKSYVEYTLKD